MGFFSKAWKSVKKGVKKVGSMAEDFYESEIGRAVTYAALAAGAIYTGGAALGAMGLTGAGAAAGGGLAGAAAGGGAAAGSMGGIATAIAAGSMGSSSAQAEQAAEEQAYNQAVARQEAYQAQRESEILRKQALLASEKSMTARKAAASTVANKLKNTSGMLGDDEEEKLGG